MGWEGCGWRRGRGGGCDVWSGLGGRKGMREKEIRGDGVRP